MDTQNSRFWIVSGTSPEQRTRYTGDDQKTAQQNTDDNVLGMESRKGGTGIWNNRE
jgi:hypothetical protein